MPHDSPAEDRQLTWIRLEAEMAIQNRRKPIISGRELLALVELVEVVKQWSEEPCDDHSTLTEVAMCQALAKVKAL